MKKPRRGGCETGACESEVNPTPGCLNSMLSFHARCLAFFGKRHFHVRRLHTLYLYFLQHLFDCPTLAFRKIPLHEGGFPHHPATQKSNTSPGHFALSKYPPFRLDRMMFAIRRHDPNFAYHVNRSTARSCPAVFAAIPCRS